MSNQQRLSQTFPKPNSKILKIDDDKIFDKAETTDDVVHKRQLEVVKIKMKVNEANYENVIREKDDEIRSLQSKGDKLERENESQRQKIYQLDNANINKDSAIEKLTTRERELTDKITQLEKQVEDIQLRAAVRCQKQENEIQTLKEELVAIRDKLNKITLEKREQGEDFNKVFAQFKTEQEKRDLKREGEMKECIRRTVTDVMVQILSTNENKDRNINDVKMNFHGAGNVQVSVNHVNTGDNAMMTRESKPIPHINVSPNLSRKGLDKKTWIPRERRKPQKPNK